MGKGGPRPGAGRKPEAWKKLANQAASQEIDAEALREIFRTMLSYAKAGQVRAAEFIFDRTVGKVPQPVDVTTGGQPMKALVGVDPDEI